MTRLVRNILALMCLCAGFFGSWVVTSAFGSPFRGVNPLSPLLLALICAPTLLGLGVSLLVYTGGGPRHNNLPAPERDSGGEESASYRRRQHMTPSANQQDAKRSGADPLVLVGLPLLILLAGVAVYLMINLYHQWFGNAGRLRPDVMVDGVDGRRRDRGDAPRGARPVVRGRRSWSRAPSVGAARTP